MAGSKVKDVGLVFGGIQPFKCLNITGPVHMIIQIGVLIKTLRPLVRILERGCARYGRQS